MARCTSPLFLGSAIFSACLLRVPQLASSQRAPCPGATGLRNMGGPWSGKGPRRYLPYQLPNAPQPAQGLPWCYLSPLFLMSPHSETEGKGCLQTPTGYRHSYPVVAGTSGFFPRLLPREALVRSGCHLYLLALVCGKLGWGVGGGQRKERKEERKGLQSSFLKAP